MTKEMGKTGTGIESDVEGCYLRDQEFAFLSDTATALVDKPLPSGPLYTMVL